MGRQENIFRLRPTSSQLQTTGVECSINGMERKIR